MKLETEEIETACPVCGALVECVTGDGIAEPGDYVICIECGAINTLTEARVLRASTPDELAAMPRAVHRMAAFIAQRAAERRARLN